MDGVLQQYETACKAAALFDLSASTKVELAGPEALSFLHNLCTNDVKNLAVGAGCEAFLTTAKARVISHVFMGHYTVNGQSVLWLDAVPGQADTLVRHLNHYLISEQVEITDRTGELTLQRVVGPGAQALLEQSLKCDLAGLPNIHHLAVPLPGGASGFVRRFDALSLPAFDVFGPKDTSGWIAGLSLLQADADVHEILRIEAGLPVFGSDIDENRLVMEVGRAAQAICYTKGCFLGQEPIVMARDRGQVNRMLMGVKVASGSVLPRGAKLFSGAAEVGEVTSSVYSPRLGQVIALAYLKRGFQASGLELVINPATDGRGAVVANLPFIA
jgi:folate-binding protein YgfZ